jgi:hypothetical protein
MQSMKKVLIISPEYMGYIVKVADNLRKTETVTVTDIHIPKYKYKSLSYRILNFFLKWFSKDLKFTYRDDYINQIINNENYDIILIIRPDMLALTTLKRLKSKTKLMKTYFFDGIYRFPRQIKTIPFFNEIYSFEPDDCKEFGFHPITNFIYEEIPFKNVNSNSKYSVFNITSYDKKRFLILSRIVNILKKQKLEYKIIVKTNKKIQSNNGIDIIQKSISLGEAKLHLEKSICMLDLGVINKHKGLTFRIFEAMGLHKKIITNNKDIANYDFYNPQNILIIDEKNIKIPSSFFDSKYEPIPKEIYKKYTLSSWVKTVFREVLD